jgi:maleate isomerase
MIEEVVGEGCDVAVVLCTNMRGAGAAARLEQKLGVPVLDSIAVTLWACLVATGADPGRIQGWGGLFSISAPTTI